jgi:hypothetical protein
VVVIAGAFVYREVENIEKSVAVLTVASNANTHKIAVDNSNKKNPT